ncbi:MAG TPA: hypothetical protein VME24_06560 [Alphaproteobacteria bacterium]|nr:hypothetical protein [Alphaproteobacteria bacterium]
MRTTPISLTRRWMARIVPTLCAALVIWATPVSAAIPPLENLLPADTLFLLDAPDCAALRAASHQSPQWLFWNDPAMKPFHDKFVAKWEAEFIAPLERDLGVKLDDFTDLPQGQFAFAFTQNGWTGTNDANPGLLLLLDTKNKSNLLKTNLANLRQKWTQTGKSLQTETLHGIQFSVVTLSSNDMPGVLAKIFPTAQPVQELGRENPPPPPPARLFVGQFESLLIAGNSRSDIETVSSRLTGGSNPSLNDNPVFAADRLSQFHGSPLYYGWFNSRDFFNVLARIPEAEPNPDAPSPFPAVPWTKILNASGLTGLKSISFACHQSREGTRADFFISAPEDDRQGLVKMISASQKEANPPSFVPADAVKFFRWRLDGRQTWATLQKMLGEISPIALASLNSFIDIANSSAQQRDPNFDIRKNLIGNLGDDWISYQKKPTGTTLADLNQAPSIFIFASPHPEQTALALKSVMGLGVSADNPPPTRDFLGRKIYTIPLRPRATAETTQPVSRSLYCTASGGYVALSGNESMVEDYLRSADSHAKPLRETDGLSDAIQHVGGTGNGLFGYENQRELMRSVFAALKNDPNSAANMDNVLMRMWGGSLGDWLDFSLLPDYDQVAKYFYFTVYSGRTTSDGLTFEFFTPRPPQLRQ